MAQWLGYMSWHDKDARKNVRGHPDLLLIGTTYPQVVYLELKRQHEKARPTNWQVDFPSTHPLHRSSRHVARPSDMDLIESILREEVEVPEIGTGKFDPRVSGLIAYEHESHTLGSVLGRLRSLALGSRIRIGGRKFCDLVPSPVPLLLLRALALNQDRSGEVVEDIAKVLFDLLGEHAAIGDLG